MLINATAGNFKQFQITFWSQIVLGFLYSFGYFESKIAGLILGFIMPTLWVVLTYRFLHYKSKKNIRLPFPQWMQKNPGNMLVILLDVIFLGLIWTIILSGWYESIWLKVMFTIVFPVLTLTMLRNLVIFPFEKLNPGKNKEEEEEKETSEQENIDEARKYLIEEELEQKRKEAEREKENNSENDEKRKSDS